jgi:hypothetical protein
MDFVQFAGKDHLIEFPDHLPRPEGAEIAALTAGRAGGVLLRHLCEIGSPFNFSFQLQAFRFGRYQDVAGSCSSHSFSPIQDFFVGLAPW